MFFSALTLAAMLQAAPLASQAVPIVVIPEAAPVVGHKGYWLQQRPFNADERVDQLRLPAPLKAKQAFPKAYKRFPSQQRVIKRPPPRRDFAFNPQAANCKSAGLQRAGHPEALQVQPLSKMSQAHGERAVVRLVDGCPVPVLVAQNDPLH